MMLNVTWKLFTPTHFSPALPFPLSPEVPRCLHDISMWMSCEQPQEMWSVQNTTLDFSPQAVLPTGVTQLESQKLGLFLDFCFRCAPTFNSLANSPSLTSTVHLQPVHFPCFQVYLPNSKILAIYFSIFPSHTGLLPVPQTYQVTLHFRVLVLFE